MKLCLLCQHFNIENDPGYSEMTPGSGLTIECWKNRWRLSPTDVSPRSVREVMATAENCPDFVEVKK